MDLIISFSRGRNCFRSLAVPIDDDHREGFPFQPHDHRQFRCTDTTWKGHVARGDTIGKSTESERFQDTPRSLKEIGGPLCLLAG